MLALSAATTVELSFFIRSYEKKLGLTGLRDSAKYKPSGYVLLSAGGMFRLAGAVFAAIATAFAPLLAYAATYLLTANHTEALVGMAAVATGELILVQALLNRT